MRRVSTVMAPLQAVAGIAFMTGSTSLNGLLYLALAVLLTWVGTRSPFSPATPNQPKCSQRRRST